MKMLRVGMIAMAGVVMADVSVAQSGGVDTSKAAAQSFAITQGQSGQTISLHVGDEAVVTLAAGSGMGNYWQMEPLGPLESPVAVLASTEAVAIPPAMPGGPVNHLFHVQIKSAGTVTLRFDLLSVRMPGARPMQTFTVTLQAQ